MELGQAWDISEVTANDRVGAKTLSIVKKDNFKNGILSIPNLFKKRSDDKPNNDTIMVTRISCRSISRQLCWSS